MSHERLQWAGRDILSRSPRACVLFDAQGERLTEPQPPRDETAARTLEQYRPDAREALALLETLGRYRIVAKDRS